MVRKPTYEELEQRVKELEKEVVERKRAEDALRKGMKELERFKIISEKAGYGIGIIDLEGNLAYVNESFAQMHQYTVSELIGSHLSILHTEEQMKNVGSLKRQLEQTGSYVGEEMWHQRKDGTIFPALMTGTSINDNTGKPLYLSATAINIEDRKKTEEALRESEERLQSIIDETTAVIYLKDMHGKFILINRQFETLFHITKDQIIGKTDYDIFPQEAANAMKENDQKVIDLDGVVEFEEIVPHDDGPHTYISIKFPIRDASGVPYGVCGISTDITERKKLEAQLQQAQKMESIGTLAGGIAHDFNNILSPIMIHSEMVMEDLPNDSPLQFNLKEIFKAGERARDMVKQILLFSRKGEGEQGAIKITPILKEVLKMLRSSIPTTIDIQQNLDAESNTVLADPTQIHLIILNLGANAAHAMRDKGGILEVSLVQEDLDSETAAQYSDLTPGSYLKLTVKDTGSGIDDETMQRIFKPYFTTKAPGEGTGMGLALVHGIAKSYGGDITVESEPGKGTTFNVYLPRIEADVSPVEEREAEFTRGIEHILFVDDEKGAVDAIQPMLENLGYKVTARTNSIEALEAFRNKPDAFDLVVTDMTMPNMTGKELAKELMQIRSEIPIILCTGFSEQIDEDRAKEMGISAFVMKPIVMREMANTIREVLDKK